MTAGHSSAIEQALALLRAPALLPSVRQRPLPEDLPQLFRLAAGDEEALAQIEAATGEARPRLAEAATFYLQQVLFAPGADHYRTLGVAAGASDEQIRQHYRLLLRWLHPDRNRDEWDAVYADRVNRAWQDLRTPERRAAYDRQRSEQRGGGADVVAPAAGGFRARPPVPVAASPVLSSRTVRRLPWLVLGGLGALATAGLAGIWYLQQLDQDGVRESQAPVVAALAPTAPELSEPDSAKDDAEAAPPAVRADAPAIVPASSIQPVTEAAAPESPARRPVAEPEVAGSRQVLPSPHGPAAAARRNADAMPEIRPEARHAAVSTGRPAEPASALAVSDRAATASESVGANRPAPAQAMPMAEQAPVVAAPAAEQVARVAVPVPSPGLGEHQAMALLEQFRRNYAGGDLAALLGLFTADARNNRGGLTAIAEDYERLFKQSDRRDIDWVDPVWLGNGNRGSITARYRATLLHSGKLRASKVEGDIRFDLRLDGDAVRIERVLHR